MSQSLHGNGISCSCHPGDVAHAPLPVASLGTNPGHSCMLSPPTLRLPLSSSVSLSHQSRQQALDNPVSHTSTSCLFPDDLVLSCTQRPVEIQYLSQSGNQSAKYGWPTSVLDCPSPSVITTRQQSSACEPPCPSTLLDKPLNKPSPPLDFSWRSGHAMPCLHRPAQATLYLTPRRQHPPRPRCSSPFRTTAAIYPSTVYVYGRENHLHTTVFCSSSAARRPLETR